eukprot:COSAG04_NODE_14756_length_556_cov_1.013129_1_plen_91_part_10
MEIAAGSQTIVAHDMTILLAVPPDCLKASDQLVEKEQMGRLKDYFAETVNSEAWIQVAALPVSKCVFLEDGPELAVPAPVSAEEPPSAPSP